MLNYSAFSARCEDNIVNRRAFEMRNRETSICQFCAGDRFRNVTMYFLRHVRWNYWINSNQLYIVAMNRQARHKSLPYLPHASIALHAAINIVENSMRDQLRIAHLRARARFCHDAKRSSLSLMHERSNVISFVDICFQYRPLSNSTDNSQRGIPASPKSSTWTSVRAFPYSNGRTTRHTNPCNWNTSVVANE